MDRIHIIGGGLAGSEAAHSAARSGISVTLHEMRPVRKTAAHESDQLAELVCSNSFRSDDANNNAVGLLHEELRRCGSLIMHAADKHKVPAGSALAVDRVAFAATITEEISNNPLITLERGEIEDLSSFSDSSVIVATGPLTSAALADDICKRTGLEALAFFDAIAPIAYFDSVDMDQAWMQSRYDKTGPGGTGKDYINCPLNREQYEAFIDALINGEKTEFREFEANTPYFDGCLPIEVMAERGRETLRHGPMKPMGLTNSHKRDEKPYAVVQLRQDNALGTLYNMVGFQTKLKYGVQTEIFRMIPGLEKAQFARLGGIHRNTYINSPSLLDHSLALKSTPSIRFAGQITGCEGYIESAATGLMASAFAVAQLQGLPIVPPPPETALGALLAHITGGHLSATEATAARFQPMNINFGLFPPIQPPSHTEDGQKIRGKQRMVAKRQALCRRALEMLPMWSGYRDIKDGL